MEIKALGLAVAIWCVSGSAAAGESLSCRVQRDLAAGAGATPKVSEFIGSTAHDSSEPTGAVATNIGKIRPDDDLANITLDGKSIQLQPEARGLIRFGNVYDYGDRVALAYLVEREDDASATPSQVVLLLNKNGTVSETDVLPGTASSTDGHCTLIE